MIYFSCLFSEDAEDDPNELGNVGFVFECNKSDFVAD